MSGAWSIRGGAAFDPWAGTRETLGNTLVLALVLLVPSLLWIGFGDPVEVPKHLAWRVVALLLAVLVALDPRRRGVLAGLPVVPPMAGLGTVSILAALAGVSTRVGLSGEDGSWMGALTLASTCAGAAVVAAWTGFGGRRRVAAGIMAAALLALAYASIQAAGLDPFPWDASRRGGYWLMAALGNPVHLGSLLVAAFGLTLLPMPRGAVARRILQVLLVAGILATKSRSALLALAVVIAVGWLRSGRRPSGVAMLAAAPVAALPLLSAVERILGLERIVGARPALWDAAVRLASAHPLVGIGPDLFYSWFPSVAGYGFYCAEPPVISGDSVAVRLPASPHDEPLAIAAGTGALGLGCYLWLLAVVVRAGRASAFLPAVAGVWTVHLVNPSGAVSLGLLLVLAALATVRPAREGLPRSGPAVLLVAGTTAAVLGWGAWDAVRLGTAQAFRRETGRLAFFGEYGALERHLERWDLRMAAVHPRQAADAAAAWRILWERDRSSNGPANRSAILLERAIAGNPMNVFYPAALADLAYERGLRPGGRGELGTSEVFLRRALEIAPSILSLHDDLARTLDAMGRRREAGEERRLRRDSDPRGVFAAGSSRKP